MPSYTLLHSLQIDMHGIKAGNEDGAAIESDGRLDEGADSDGPGKFRNSIKIK